MEIESCTKTEAVMLRRFGHTIFASLDQHLQPVQYFTNKADVVVEKTARDKAHRRQIHPRIYGDTKLNLVDRDYIFTRTSSRQKQAYDLLLKKFLKPKSVMRRQAIEDYLEQALNVDHLTASSLLSVFLHKLNIFEVAK